MRLFLESNYHKILFFSFLVATIFAGDQFDTDVLAGESGIGRYSPSTHPPSNVRVKIETKCGRHEFLNLKKTNQVLANKHLPVWSLRGIVNKDTTDNYDDTKLELITDVMNQLGEFTMYQESETTSAAVYFHHNRKFNGIIDYRYLVQGLSIDEIDNTDEDGLKVDESAIVARRTLARRSRKRKMKNPGQIFVINFDEKVMKIDEKKSTLVRTTRATTNHGYPEILVFVSCELADELMKTGSESEKYTSVVSYVLTLFNGVDMLYSKLKDTKIELNIAGIIIGTECDSLPIMTECYDGTTTGKKGVERMLNTHCTNEQLRQHLFRYKNFIPTGSYDIVAFLTKNTLFHFKRGPDGNTERNYVKGQALCSVDPLYKCRESGQAIILTATVKDEGDLGNYADLAHEMAHLMTVKHDEPVLLEAQCNMNIMKCRGIWCERCLTWSDTSEATFKAFFSSRDSCTFINKPGSLDPSGPRQIMTADEQCQCYGHESAIQSSKAIPIVDSKYCKTPLLCKGHDNLDHSTIIPMDGTPCADEKVCWNKHCTKIKSVTSTDS